MGGYTVYIVDFGLSRSFGDHEQSQTDRHSGCTPVYCSPEVHASESHGRASDIFSLGCVFTEILTVYHIRDLDEFADHRCGNGDNTAFHATLNTLPTWLSALCLHPPSLQSFILTMLSNEPAHRPTASQTKDFFLSLPDTTSFRGDPHCCSRGPEPFEAYQGESAT